LTVVCSQATAATTISKSNLYNETKNGNWFGHSYAERMSYLTYLHDNFRIPPSSKSLHWDFNRTYSMAHFSAVAYCDNDIYEWTCPNCKNQYTKDFKVTHTVYDKKTDCHGYVGYSPTFNAILVVFRGTKSFQNVLEDLKFSKMVVHPGSPGAKVHKGMYEMYLAVEDKVTQYVNETKKDYPQATQIFVVGHSLGAGIAVLAAERMQLTYEHIQVFNYGCPRVGNEIFAKYYDSVVPATTKLVHNADPIPHLPTLFMGFYHTATEVWHVKDNYIVCDSTGEDPHCSDSLKIALSLNDHREYMGFYTGCK